MYNDALNEIDYNQWEWFVQDILYYLGFKILESPSEGVDNGIDIKVELNNIIYLVSCKHHKKSIGINSEIDIRDRLATNNCQGFIAFYSSSPTSGLKEKFKGLIENNIQVIEFYKDNIFEIIPNMPSFILQKYFKNPQNLKHHINTEATYKKLICMEEDCNKDLLSKENIHLSLASLYYDEKDKMNLVYGCKICINKYLDDTWEWVELTQIRHIEQLISWRYLIDEKTNNNKPIDNEFYKNWALLQEGMTQVMIPIGWGKWI